MLPDEGKTPNRPAPLRRDVPGLGELLVVGGGDGDGGGDGRGQVLGELALLLLLLLLHQSLCLSSRCFLCCPRKKKF